MGDIFFRFGLLALAFVGDATIEVGLEQLRIEPNGLSVVGNGLVKFTLLQVGVASVEVGRGVLRVEPDGLRVLDNRKRPI
jgi:hypothetical protein